MINNKISFWYISIIISLITGIVGLSFVFLRNEVINSTLQEEQEKKYSIIQQKADVYKDYIIWSLYDEIKIVDLSNLKNQNSGGKTYNNLEFPKLVFRFSERNCAACVNAVVPVLRNKFHLSMESKLIYLTDYKVSHYLQEWINEHQVSSPVLNLEGSSLNLKLENMNFPYFFVVDSNHVISHVFIPEKTEPQNTERYIDLIINKYFKK